MNKLQYIKLLELRGITELDEGQSVSDAVYSSGGLPTDEEMIKTNELVFLYYRDEVSMLRDKLEAMLKEKVSLSKEVEYLQKRDNILTALESAGVDNWTWYGEALDVLCDECGDFKEDTNSDVCAACQEKED